jgi:hypothetical protein
VSSEGAKLFKLADVQVPYLSSVVTRVLLAILGIAAIAGAYLARPGGDIGPPHRVAPSSVAAPPKPAKESVKIIMPANGSCTTQHDNNVSGNATRLPGHELWVLVYASGANTFFVQSLKPIEPDIDGRWFAKATLGGSKDDYGSTYTVHVVIVSSEGIRQLHDAVIARPRQVHEIPIEKFPDGVTAHATASVALEGSC